MKTHCLTTVQSILENREHWHALAGDHPFCNWEWMSSWYQTYGTESEIRVAIFEEDGQWFGLLPMIQNQTRRGRQLEFASSGRACADYVGPVIRPGSEDIVIPMMFEWLKSQLDDREDTIDLVEWNGASSQDANLNQLLEMFEQDSHKISRVEIEGCWVAELEPSWETFQAGISKSFRRKLKKAARNRELEEVDTFCVTNPSELESVWPHFERLHQLRRQELGQEGCFSDESFGPFLKSAVSKMMQEGRAQFVGAKFDGTPYAMMLLLTGGKKTYMYQTGTDPELKRLEPGHLLGVLAVQLAIESGHTHFDYLRGDEPYKSRWRTQRIPLQRIQIISQRIPSQIKHQIWQTGRAIKNWLPAGLALSNPN